MGPEVLFKLRPGFELEECWFLVQPQLWLVVILVDLDTNLQSEFLLLPWSCLITMSLPKECWTWSWTAGWLPGLISELSHHCAIDLGWWLDQAYESELLSGCPRSPCCSQPSSHKEQLASTAPSQPRSILFTSVSLGLQCLYCQGVRCPAPVLFSRAALQGSVPQAGILG